MTKRLISLILAMLMLLAVFTSCGEDEDAITGTMNEAARYTSAMNLWMITESTLVEKASKLLADGYDPDDFVGDKLTERTDAEKAAVAKLTADEKAAWEQLDDITEALNKITKKQFKTQVTLRCYTEANYYTEVEKAYAAHEKALAEAKKTGQPLIPENQADETVLNEYGVPELKYPTPYDFQVDILFIGDVVKYREYADAEKITSIDDMLENSAVKLSYYVSDVLLKSASYKGATFGVPNNHTIGEYTYLAVNEELANYYLTTPEKLENSVFSNESYKFLEYVYAKMSKEENEADKIYPIYSETGTLDLNMLHYWSYNADSANETYIQTPATFSLFGGFYKADAVQGTLVNATNLLANNIYSTYLQRKLYYEKTADYITTDFSKVVDEEVAMCVVKGDYSKREELEKAGYTVLVAEQPRVTDEDVFTSMFAVGANTRDESRAMEIITYLNTNAEMRNILQYGLQDKNYELKTFTDKSGKEYVWAEMLEGNKYVMDITKTGNMFIAYPNAKETNVEQGKYGVTAWEIGKNQNLDAKAYPTVGLYFNTQEYKENKSGFKVNDKNVRVLNAVSTAFEENVLNHPEFTHESAKALYDAASLISTDYAEMAKFVLDAIKAAGVESVTYKDANGATAVVTEADLMLVLMGMHTQYSMENTREGTVQSTNVLYQEWRDSNGFKS